MVSDTIKLVTEVLTAALGRRVSRAGSMPLITYYDESTGERTELSALSFANWVDKTAGLLTDELLVDPGARVRLRLADSHPAHWVTLAWVVASWRAGCTVLTGDAGKDDDHDAAVEVVGPEQAYDSPGAAERVACSLHPLGLGFANPLPQGVIDYGTEVRAQPDSYGGPHPDPRSAAWIDPIRTLTHAEIAKTAGDDRRLMITPGNADPWPIIERALIRPVRGGGSSVIVINADAGRQARIAETEQATHAP